mgnify:CR=1 FL=1
MPCLECENGLWRFGESGKCQYSSKSECETANADYYAEEIDNNNMEEKKKYYGDEEHDYHFNFTTDMMEKLHSEGELEVKVENDGQEMLILFTFDGGKEEEVIIDKSDDKIIALMLDEELDDYINKLTDSIKKL